MAIEDAVEREPEIARDPERESEPGPVDNTQIERKPQMKSDPQLEHEGRGEKFQIEREAEIEVEPEIAILDNGGNRDSGLAAPLQNALANSFLGRY